MKIQASIFIIFAIAIIGGCKNATTVVENNADMLQGTVTLYVNCTPLSIDSGATVHIEGTGFSATTNLLGGWTMNDVPAGIYNIIITKPGFDTDLIPQYQFSGAGTQFIENGRIGMATPLLDSVLISSIQVTKKDSIDIISTTMYGDTGHLYYDTVAHIYSVIISYRMSGPDSTVNFRSNITDITSLPDSSGSYLWNELSSFSVISPTILQNQNITQTGTINGIIPYQSYWGGSPKPGDTIVVKTISYTTCSGRNTDTLSKSFVLP